MENYLLTVIVPAYNAAHGIERCLDSILGQTYQNLEIIVINDGSTDNTPEIIENYKKKDHRVVTIHQPNKGLAATRSVGIEAAKGDFIGFVDADDYIDPDMYERLLGNAIRYDADISHCGVNFCYPDGRDEPHYGTGKLVVNDTDEGLIALFSGKQIEPAVWNKIYRREILLDSCLDPTIYCNEDFLRNSVAFQRARRSVYEDFCGYKYIQHPGGDNLQKRIENARQIFKARKLVVENSPDSVRQYAVSAWIFEVMHSFSSCGKERSAEVKDFLAESRAFIKEHKKDIRYLAPEHRIAAYMIIYCPKLYLFLFHNVYKKSKALRK